MAITIEKIPGGFKIDELELKTGKCGCTSILPCCHSFSKVKKSGNQLIFTAKASNPNTQDNFKWGYKVKKDDYSVEVEFEDARDKVIFSGFYPPALKEWTDKGWKWSVKKTIKRTQISGGVLCVNGCIRRRSRILNLKTFLRTGNVLFARQARIHLKK